MNDYAKQTQSNPILSASGGFKSRTYACPPRRLAGCSAERCPYGGQVRLAYGGQVLIISLCLPATPFGGFSAVNFLRAGACPP